MAITQVGSTLQFDKSDNANTGTVTSTMTVPSGTQIALVAVSGYQGTTNGLAGMTLTKGSADTAMTRSDSASDSSIGNTQAALFYLAAPDIGANMTLKWDWVGSAASTGSGFFTFSVTFWQGIDTASPVRSGGGGAAGSLPITSATLTASSGDLIVAYVGGDASAEGSISTWSNVSTLTQLTFNGFVDGAWATGSPSGNTTVAASTGTNFGGGGIAAVVLKPAATNKTLDATVGGSYALTGTNASMHHAYKLSAPVAGAYNITGTTVTVGMGLIIENVGTYVITGTTASIKHAWKAVAATVGAYTITGTNAALTKSGNKTMGTTVGTYTITGTNATLLYSNAPLDVRQNSGHMLNMGRWMGRG